MNINELFEELEDEFYSDELRGEFNLHGNVIIWSYCIADENEEMQFIEDDEDEYFNFDAESDEEFLLSVYREEIEKIREFLDEMEETENWSFSDAEIVDNTILFKIF